MWRLIPSFPTKGQPKQKYKTSAFYGIAKASF